MISIKMKHFHFQLSCQKYCISISDSFFMSLFKIMSGRDPVQLSSSCFPRLCSEFIKFLWTCTGLLWHWENPFKMLCYKEWIQRNRKSFTAKSKTCNRLENQITLLLNNAGEIWHLLGQFIQRDCEILLLTWIDILLIRISIDINN